MSGDSAQMAARPLLSGDDPRGAFDVLYAERLSRYRACSDCVVTVTAEMLPTAVVQLVMEAVGEG